MTTAWTVQVKRCDDMARKLRFFTDQASLLAFFLVTFLNVESSSRNY